MRHSVDFLVVGGGIAGVAVGAELASKGRVLLIERENSLAYHTTGRSAAISMESYGNQLIRQLTCASRSFFEQPPAELTSEALMSARGALILGDDATLDKLSARYRVVSEQVPSAQWIDKPALRQFAGFLAERWVAGIYEPSAYDLDVHAIHSAFVRGIRRRDGAIRMDTEIVSAERTGSSWNVELAGGESISTGVIINAAGAWADVVAARCGATPLGIQPLLRTVVVVDPEQDVSHCPYLGSVDEQLFIKPDAGRLMVSPCDETSSLPCDAHAAPLAVAIAMDRLEAATRLRPQRVLNRWAGLRTFAPDRSPLLGPDPSSDSFVWCAALGGYGIQTAPALARVCAAIATRSTLPDDLARLPVESMAPARMLGGGADRRVVAVAELH